MSKKSTYHLRWATFLHFRDHMAGCNMCSPAVRKEQGRDPLLIPLNPTPQLIQLPYWRSNSTLPMMPLLLNSISHVCTANADTLTKPNDVAYMTLLTLIKCCSTNANTTSKSNAVELTHHRYHSHPMYTIDAKNAYAPAMYETATTIAQTPRTVSMQLML